MDSFAIADSDGVRQLDLKDRRVTEIHSVPTGRLLGSPDDLHGVGLGGRGLFVYGPDGLEVTAPVGPKLGGGFVDPNWWVEARHHPEGFRGVACAAGGDREVPLTSGEVATIVGTQIVEPEFVRAGSTSLRLRSTNLNQPSESTDVLVEIPDVSAWSPNSFAPDGNNACVAFIGDRVVRWHMDSGVIDIGPTVPFAKGKLVSVHRSAVEALVAIGDSDRRTVFRVAT